MGPIAFPAPIATEAIFTKVRATYAKIKILIRPNKKKGKRIRTKVWEEINREEGRRFFTSTKGAILATQP